MLQIHPNARTTPVTRAKIACSHERTGVLAQRYGVSTETIRKWRKRGAADCLDHSARPHHLPWKATEEERAIVCTLRRVTNFALDAKRTTTTAGFARYLWWGVMQHGDASRCTSLGPWPGRGC